MRHPRIKPAEGQDAFVHVYNRTAGNTGQYPFGKVEKTEFQRRVAELNEYYAVEVLATQVMGNHFHILVYIPPRAPSAEEAAERYNRRYRPKHPMRANSRRCEKLQHKLRDLSEFMAELQQPFSRWFNRTRRRRRRGHLWAERFKHTVLEQGLALWKCWAYTQMNPVRAFMVTDPADYRFGSFGQWCGTGKHPFERALLAHVLPWLRGLLHVETLADVQRELRKEFARLRAEDRRQSQEQTNATIAVAAETEPFVTRLDRRVRYWVDGLVIGSEQFVRETMIRARGAAALKKRRLTRAREASGVRSELYCFKQLRVLLE